MKKYSTLGDRIKGLRQSLGMSQREAAEQLHCTQAAWSLYENGNREPGIRELVKIASVLNTSTDYLLGITEIKSVDANIKEMGDYLGLTEESIRQLHDFYWEYRRKIDNDYLQKEVKSHSGAVPGDEKYKEDFQNLSEYYQIDLNDYVNFINEFICSSAFRIFSRCVCNNLFLERTIYDLLHVLTKQYDQIESQVFESDIAAKAHALMEDSEDFLKQYSLNVFEVQNVIVDFTKNFTKLEVIKELDYKENFYGKLQFYLYEITHSMFEKKEFSFQILDEALTEDKYKLTSKALEILKEY